MKLLSVLALLTFSALVSADNRDGIPGRISRSHVQPSVASARISVGNGNGSSRPRTQNKISDFPGLTNVDDPPTSSSSSPSPPSPPSPPPPAWQASRALINPADDTFTNAERMRRGLPLKAPRRRSRLSRTRTVAARAPAPSPTYCGRLRVETSDSRYSGYVAQNLDDQGRYVVTPDRARAASVYYRDHQLHPMGGNGVYPVLGATFGDVYQGQSAINTLADNSYNFAVLTGTGETDYGVPAMPGISSYKLAPDNGVESSIFTLSTYSEEIFATWINPDGSRVPLTWVVPSEGDLHPLILSANVEMFNSVFGGYSARVFCEAT